MVPTDLSERLHSIYVSEGQLERAEMQAQSNSFSLNVGDFTKTSPLQKNGRNSYIATFSSQNEQYHDRQLRIDLDSSPIPIFTIYERRNNEWGFLRQIDASYITFKRSGEAPLPLNEVSFRELRSWLDNASYAEVSTRDYVTITLN